MDNSISGLINRILEIIEKPLKKERPNVKDALTTINHIREICNESLQTTNYSISTKDNVPRYSFQRHMYKCLYQCGFKTISIREIDNHLTNVHGHPDPKRDYSNPIYNES